ncbi:hypothetical protein LTR12_015883 [Friedmanniomyces endolithicus]|nr:hypothetical protein LTR12_015883 [Friedmanniomyces endolithicus]
MLESHTGYLALTFSDLFALVKNGERPSLQNNIRFGTDPNHCHVLLGHRGTQGISGQHYTISVNQDLSAAHDRDDSTAIFKGIVLNSYPSTAAPSGKITPSTRPLYYSTAVLGKGEFGQVSLVVQARTGQCFAAKTFFDHNKKRHAGERDEAWRRDIRREYEIVALNPHSNIVKAFELQEEPMMIIMEYYPGGNIEDVCHDVSEIDYVSAFGQVLSALVFSTGMASSTGTSSRRTF